MAGHQLAAVVHVQDDEHGLTILGPGDKVPDWALPLIPNPKAWVGGTAPEIDGDDDEQGEGDKPPAPRRTTRRRGPARGAKAGKAAADEDKTPGAEQDGEDKVPDAEQDGEDEDPDGASTPADS